jgi:hypothetical protein
LCLSSFLFDKQCFISIVARPIIKEF